MRRGRFVMIDGPDAAGKSVLEGALVSYCEENSGRVFDGVNFGSGLCRPTISDVGNCNVILSGEPTNYGIGRDIRHVVTVTENAEVFPNSAVVRYFGDDREIQLRTLIIPALKAGIDVFQGRGVCTTCNYQVVDGDREGVSRENVLEEIFEHLGNAYALENGPDLLALAVVKDVDILMGRLGDRKKKDNSYFERRGFLEKVLENYKSDWFREIFEKVGSRVAYVDTGISIESSMNQVVELYEDWRVRGEVPERYSRVPNFRK
jgi:thymidylate kinase